MAVTRDSVGTSAVSTGAALSFAGPVIATPGMGTVVLVAVIQSVATNGTSFGATVTYAGSAMTAIGAFTQLGSTTSRSGIGWFWMYHPAAGSSTVVVTPTGTTAKTRMAAFAQAYSGVDFLTGPVAGFAKTTAASLTLSAPSYAGGITVAATVNGAALSAPTQTQLYNNFVSVGGVGDALLVQEAAGTGSNISFSSTGTATTPTTQSVQLPAAQPAATSRQEPFDDNSYGWSLVNGAAIAGGVATLSGPTTTASSTVGGPTNYNLIGSSVTIQMTTIAVATGDNTDCYPLFLDAGFNTGYEYGFVYGQGTGNLHTFYSVGTGRNFDAGRTYDPINHQFFRVRESGGSIFWDVSADGNNWVNLRSMAIPWKPYGFNLNISQVTYPSGTITTPMTVDNYNIIPPQSGSLPAPVRRPNYGSLLQL